jgi:hypothetical protein
MTRTANTAFRSADWMATRLAAFALSVVMTVAMFSGIGHLASADGWAEVLSARNAAVVVGERG